MTKHKMTRAEMIAGPEDDGDGEAICNKPVRCLCDHPCMRALKLWDVTIDDVLSRLRPGRQADRLIVHRAGLVASMQADSNALNPGGEAEISNDERRADIQARIRNRQNYLIRTLKKMPAPTSKKALAALHKISTVREISA